MSDLHVSFDHGLGDCVNFARLLQLYRRRNYRIFVHASTDGELIWKAAGLGFGSGQSTNYHPWLPGADFNRPHPRNDWSGNKIAANIGRDPLPQIGDVQELWEELSSLAVDGWLDPHIPNHTRARVRASFEGLDRPIVLLHTVGCSDPLLKNLPMSYSTELQLVLLERMSGTLIDITGDAAGQILQHPRFYRLRGDLSLEILAAVMAEADLLVGIDSGPYHFAAMTDIAVLGIFHGFYPSCVALPRPKTVNMAPAAFKELNNARRRRWNIVEYDGLFPRVGDVVHQAQRLLGAPRYGLPIGRDVVAQQQICDGISSHREPHCQSLDYDKLFLEVSARFAEPYIHMIGGTSTWGSSMVRDVSALAAYLEARQGGHLAFVDERSCQCRAFVDTIRPWKIRATIRNDDVFSWLEKEGRSIDVLYLSLVGEKNIDRGVKALKAAQNRLSSNALVVIGAADPTSARSASHTPLTHLLENGWHPLPGSNNILVSRASNPHANRDRKGVSAGVHEGYPRNLLTQTSA